jgi:DNA-binding response OmpR family regulator
MIAGVMTEYLARWGYEDFGVPRILKRYWRTLSGFEPQLILMDVVLPYYNGYYWCAEIRKLSRVL